MFGRKNNLCACGLECHSLLLPRLLSLMAVGVTQKLPFVATRGERLRGRRCQMLLLALNCIRVLVMTVG